MTSENIENIKKDLKQQFATKTVSFFTMLSKNSMLVKVLTRNTWNVELLQKDHLTWILLWYPWQSRRYEKSV